LTSKEWVKKSIKVKKLKMILIKMEDKLIMESTNKVLLEVISIPRKIIRIQAILELKVRKQTVMFFILIKLHQVSKNQQQI